VRKEPGEEFNPQDALDGRYGLKCLRSRQLRRMEPIPHRESTLQSRRAVFLLDNIIALAIVLPPKCIRWRRARGMPDVAAQDCLAAGEAIAIPLVAYG